MSIVPVLLVLYIMLSERIRSEKSGKRSIGDVIVGIMVLLFMIAWASVREDCVSKCCEIGLSVICLQKGIELRFPVGSRMRSIMASVFLCFVGACLMALSICNCKTAARRQCALSDDSRLSFAGADSQSNDCLSPNVEWLPRKGDLHLKCDGFEYMSERDSFRVDKNMATVQALYADDSDRYCFLFKVYHREDAGWREVGCGELSLRQQAAGYDVISESASSGIDVQLVGCNAAAGNGSEREGYRAQVEIEYGSYRCRFYLRPLSEL